MRRISIEFEIQDSLVVGPEVIWPDGEPPNYTARDVREAMEGAGPKSRVLESWELFDGAQVRVFVTVDRPPAPQDEELDLDTPSRPIRDTVEVWPTH